MKVKNFLKSIVNFYNEWYGIINLIIGLCVIFNCENTTLVVISLVICVIDMWSWWHNIFKNMGTKRELFATVKQNNALCIYGGTGSGKSTLAQYLLEYFIPVEKRYYNTKVEGCKAFTNRHLLLYDKLENGFGALVDESGKQVDSYHYSKDDASTRQRIDTLNKFVRQFYGSNCLLIYVDQAQGNQNTSIYRDVYYVIQCKGVDIKASALIPNLIAKFVLFFVNRKRPDGKKINNPFSNVSIEYMEFAKLGDYAEHYSVNIDDKDHKKLVGSIYKFFGVLDTYVFRDFNPAKETKPYVWGTNELADKQLMSDNFGLSELKDEIKDSFLK